MFTQLIQEYGRSFQINIKKFNLTLFPDMSPIVQNVRFSEIKLADCHPINRLSGQNLVHLCQPRTRVVEQIFQNAQEKKYWPKTTRKWQTVSIINQSNYDYVKL